MCWLKHSDVADLQAQQSCQPAHAICLSYFSFNTLFSLMEFFITQDLGHLK